MKSVGGAEYFLTFIDDFSRYVSVYFLKRKDEVFSCFLGWKAMVERATGRKLKVEVEGAEVRQRWRVQV